MKSADCVDNKHGLCKGFFKEGVEPTQVTRICACPCHDSMYQLVRNTIALVNQAERTNPFSQNYDDRL
jgi:hypothetical protein